MSGRKNRGEEYLDKRENRLIKVSQLLFYFYESTILQQLNSYIKKKYIYITFYHKLSRF